MDPLLLTVLVVAFALVFAVSNGWNDSANAIATVVSTRVLRPGPAVLFGAFFNFAGALFSSEVAKTVGQDIADPHLLVPATFLAAVLVSPVWVALCTWRGLPIACSHALLGGLIGAVLATLGPAGLKMAGVMKIVYGVFTSPVIGFALGLAIIVALSWAFRRARPATISRVFGKLQLVSAAAMAFSHGTGDAQKAMGIITGALISAGYVSAGTGGGMPIPLWVRLACTLAMALGTAWGGWAVIRTLGMRLAHLKPVHGFAAELAGATTILANTLTGVPISTTHSITGAIIGVGAARGARSVKWGVGGKIVFAWFVTFPVCIGGGALFFKALVAAGLATRAAP
ncbi:MAG: inorganic phosphate transporter [Planctomycetes bacterium]|nr:inorganic phosphate transporter [Planctomycetota bacterium]